MITIFGDFCQFSAKKMAVFSKNNVMIKFTAYFVLSQKRNFSPMFLAEKKLKSMLLKCRAKPKSQILTTPLSVSRRFSGLMSR
jgi:hypothetical protein